VVVGADEARQDHLAGGVDHLGVVADECLGSGRVPDIDDLVAFHGHGLGPGLLFVNGVHLAAGEDGVGRFCG